MGPITRTCSFAFVLALAASSAEARRPAASAIGSYVQARVADSAGQSDVALAAYAAAMTAEPGNDLIALRAYREAIDAGDKALALRAVRQLATKDALPADARLLLVIDAMSVSDWKGVRLALDRIEEQGGYDFIVPILRAWTQLGARDGDAQATLAAIPRGSLTSSYAAEQRALILLASGKRDEGIAAIRALGASDARMMPARLAAAAKLQSMKDRAGALSLLQGSDANLFAAQTLVEAGTPLSGSIDTPSRGLAALLARISSDLMRDRVSPVALTLARLARMADAKSDQIALIEAQALAANSRDAAALAAYRAIPATSPFAADARDGMVAVLERVGRSADALALARTIIASPGAALLDHVRLGEIHVRADQQAEAARAFEEAIAFARGSDGKGSVPWGLWLLYGGSLERAGDWSKARDALKKAVDLAPEQPGPLNHLGYAMLERRENLPEALRMIERASALRPDDAAITDSLGWAYFLQGDVAKALPLLEKAVEIDGIEPTLSEHLGDVYWAAGRRIDARYAWQAARINSDAVPVQKRLDKKIDLGLTADTAAR